MIRFCKISDQKRSTGNIHKVHNIQAVPKWQEDTFASIKLTYLPCLAQLKAGTFPPFSSITNCSPIDQALKLEWVQDGKPSWFLSYYFRCPNKILVKILGSFFCKLEKWRKAHRSLKWLQHICSKWTCAHKILKLNRIKMVHNSGQFFVHGAWVIHWVNLFWK
jgi:hypothetical protein